MERYNVATVREKDGAFIYYEDHEQECQILMKRIQELEEGLKQVDALHIKTINEEEKEITRLRKALEKIKSLGSNPFVASDGELAVAIATRALCGEKKKEK